MWIIPMDNKQEGIKDKFSDGRVNRVKNKPMLIFRRNLMIYSMRDKFSLSELALMFNLERNSIVRIVKQIESESIPDELPDLEV